MSWIFRKIFRFGPFRTTLSKGGVGMSWGMPGFRVGVSANGRKYITIGIPGTGFYFTKYFTQQTQHNQQSQQQSTIQQPFQQNKTQTTNKTEEPWWKQKNL
ncbi:MAG: DUF4236 domain-containing protein [Bacteroidetes bacterium]|nr:DUF4236 domain-containing protein [Bacteroidota bacterium]